MLTSAVAAAAAAAVFGCESWRDDANAMAAPTTAKDAIPATATETRARVRVQLPVDILFTFQGRQTGSGTVPVSQHSDVAWLS